MKVDLYTIIRDDRSKLYGDATMSVSCSSLTWDSVCTYKDTSMFKSVMTW